MTDETQNGEGAPALVARALEAIPESLSSETLFLLGWGPIEEYLSFGLGQATAEVPVSTRVLVEEWRQANDRVQLRASLESNVADGVRFAAVSEPLAEQVARVEEDPMVRETFPIASPQVKLVDLDKLVVFQKRINLDYVGALKEELGSEPDDQAVFDFCFPPDHAHPPASVLPVAPGNAYVVTSPSCDLRFLGPRLLAPEAVVDLHPQGPVAALLGLMVGNGVNYVWALHVQNRLILHNGSHRLYTLYELGLRHAPCLVISLTRSEEFSLLAADEVKQNAATYLQHPRPPLLRDYFDENLTTKTRAWRTNRQVKVTFDVELTEVPTIN